MGPFKVLVVEDHADSRQVISIMLEVCGYQAIEAANGQEAVDLAASHCPDLILMDLGLPVLDGVEATRRIREHEMLRHVPIIACTAYLREDWEARASRAEFSGFIAKPVDFDSLIRVIERHLPRRADCVGAQEAAVN
jgi:CheY-like chemotaxis protein